MSSKSKLFVCDQHARNILSKLHTFYRDQLFFDIALTTKTDNLKVHAHRAVLSASSDYFLAMLCSTFKEAKSDVIELEIDGATLKAVVDFMYSGTIELNWENVARILAAAAILKMTTLKVVCADFIGETIDVTNCLSIVSMAKQQESAEIHKKAFEFALQNFEEVCKKDEQLSELISSDDLCVNSEELVFHSVVAWVKHDKGLREESMTGLLAHVRFSFLTPEFIINNRQSVSKTYECLELLFSWLESQLSGLTKRHSEQKKVSKAVRETLGFVSGAFTDNLKMQSLDPESNMWTCEDLPPSPIKRQCYSAMVVDKKLVVAGGLIGYGSGTNIVECLDLHTKKWTNLPPMRQPRTSPEMAELSGDLYVVGGESADSWSRRMMEKYNFRTREWQKLPPISKKGKVDLAVLGELLYAAVEGDPQIECFNPADSKWTQLPHKNENSDCFGIAGVGEYLYAMGGRHNGKTSETVERFNPLTNTWTVISPGLGCALRSLKCVSWNNQLVACCGRNNDYSIQNLVVEYNPDENDWMQLASLAYHQLDDSINLFTK